MYYKLSTDFITLEYMDETLSIEYMSMFVCINSSYDITNFNTILTSLYTGISIDFLSVGNLKISYDITETLYIGDDFFIEGEEVPNLIALLNQSDSIRLKMVLPKLDRSVKYT